MKRFFTSASPRESFGFNLGLWVLLMCCFPFLSTAQVVPPAGWDDFKVGLVNDNSNIINVRTKKAISEGVKLHYRYAYVNNGVDPSSNALSWLFNQWGTDYSKQSLDMGIRPAYVIYMLQEEGGVAALKSNIQNPDFMRKYFTSIRIVAEKSKGMKAIFVIEPDTWGYFLQSTLEQGTEADPRAIPANVNNLGAGYEYLNGLPNTLSGVAQATIKTIRTYAPDAYCGLLMSFWAVPANGKTGPAVPDGQKGMVYWNQSDVDYSAMRTAQFADQLFGTATDRGDFIGVEKNGWSAGNWFAKQGRDDYYWNDTQNGKWLSWSKTLREQVNLPLLGWQISIGHMGLPNTVNRYEDTFMPYFFTHKQAFMEAGFIGFLVGKGLADCTDYTNLNGNELEADGSAGDNGWFFERLKEFDAGRPYLNGGTVSASVSLTSPVNNTEFTVGTTIDIKATATAATNCSISKVEFYQGSTKLGEDTTFPYAFSWTNVAEGSYSLTARVFDTCGNMAASSSVSIQVKKNDGGDCTIPAWIATKVYVKDDQVSYNGNQYKAKWWTQGDNPAQNAGSGKVWELMGVCGDGNGNPGNQAPTVSLTAPVANSSFTAPASIAITANASDADGTITKLEFYNGSIKLGEDTSAPYSFTWNDVSVGSYSISAKAIDNQGASTISAAVSISVKEGNSGGCNASQYVENGGYAAGSLVQNEGNLYECRPYPYSGWCNGAAWAYEPGKGAYWQDAWTLQGSCTTKSGAYTIGSTESLYSREDVLNLFPNPSDGKALTISFGSAKEATISLYGINGTKAMAVYQFENVNKAVALELPALAEGMYVIRVVADKHVWTERFIVKK